MQDMTMTDAPMDSGEGSGSPLDACISTVDQFMSDPKAITPETLGQLKMDLEDLKTVMDNEPGAEPAAAPAPAGGLAGMIGGK